jgi:hypothetical protein
LLLGGVVAELVPFGLCQDAKECRIAVAYPMAEGKAANENGDAREDGIEEIESPYSADAHEVEERAFNAQVSERLMQALEHSICALLLLLFVCHNSSSKGMRGHGLERT